jgi:hypothetical protein
MISRDMHAGTDQQETVIRSKMIRLQGNSKAHDRAGRG